MSAACFLTATLSFLVQPPTQRHCLGALAAAPRVAHVTAGAAPRLACVSMVEAVEEEADIIDVVKDADAVFSVIDVNGDGSIDRAELLEHLTKAGYDEKAVNMLFDKLDTDQSESIDRNELREGFLKYTPLRTAPGLGAYNQQFVEEIHADADALFAALDKNNDGAISKDELREHLKQFSGYSFKAISTIFKTIDVNADGGIEATELRDAFVKYSALRLAIGEGPHFK